MSEDDEWRQTLADAFRQMSTSTSVSKATVNRAVIGTETEEDSWENPYESKESWEAAGRPPLIELKGPPTPDEVAAARAWDEDWVEDAHHYEPDE